MEAELTAVPVLNHLLVLWDASATVLNMLEPISALKKILNVSLFCSRESAEQMQSVSESSL